MNACLYLPFHQGIKRSGIARKCTLIALANVVKHGCHPGVGIEEGCRDFTSRDAISVGGCHHDLLWWDESRSIVHDEWRYATKQTEKKWINRSSQGIRETFKCLRSIPSFGNCQSTDVSHCRVDFTGDHLLIDVHQSTLPYRQLPINIYR